MKAWYERNKVAAAMFVGALVIMGWVAGDALFDGDWLWFTFAMVAFVLFLAIDGFVIAMSVKLDRQLARTPPPDEFLR